ncbi:MAG TPA: fibrobacter succinogenes major paralogous domain-containing protein [Bacteroidales bacterium]|nr:fibrobacter succinogenes major paralogous domain-containing protein [Bacteroidales bacterium]
MKKKIKIHLILLIGFVLILTNSCKQDDDKNNENPPIVLPNCGTVTDIDGNVYNTVTIGTQCWMKENLKVTKYRDGTLIPNITDSIVWGNHTTGAYCDYKNTPSLSTIYGKLYNGYAIQDSRKIAPTGWHVPTNAEWEILVNYLGGDTVAGGKLKEISTTHWQSPNTGATNSSGFTALPGGVRSYDFNGMYQGINGYGGWWSAPDADYWIMNYNSKSCFSSYFSQVHNGFSVRCIKD